VTTITGTGISWFRMAAFCSSLSLEINTRPLGMRSGHLKRAWPMFRKELGLAPDKPMTHKNMQLTLLAAQLKLMQLERAVKEGDITE
jgi:hypothetical protein